MRTNTVQSNTSPVICEGPQKLFEKAKGTGSISLARTKLAPGGYQGGVKGALQTVNKLLTQMELNWHPMPHCRWKHNEQMYGFLVVADGGVAWTPLQMVPDLIYRLFRLRYPP